MTLELYLYPYSVPIMTSRKIRTFPNSALSFFLAMGVHSLILSIILSREISSSSYSGSLNSPMLILAICFKSPLASHRMHKYNLMTISPISMGSFSPVADCKLAASTPKSIFQKIFHIVLTLFHNLRPWTYNRGGGSSSPPIMYP